ncbi:NAC domain-containing protein 17-like isoform X2 [Apium graveolens]|uniref:NAC domain-containing protein 17-like isoform X2 n=1 Tax=Apium graveolens TaxID=4045 RepID=UPI003D79CD71
MGVAKAPRSSSGSGSKLFPPGFRFHPTDEELVLYYLKRKICRRRLKPDIIAETDVYKWDPDDLPELSKLKTGDRQWFFLSPRDRRYPNGGRSNRATMHGYWKATGKDRTISSNSRSVGLKKTLVYYKGRAPSGVRTDWVMHEYTLDEEELKRCPSAQDYYVLYKVYKKSGLGPKNGEEYGAPFKEEEWVDVECVSFSGLLDQQNVTKEIDLSCIDNTRTKSLPQNQGDDIDEFLNKIVDETVFDPPPLNVCSYTFDQFFAEKENGSTLLNHCSGDVSLDDQSMVPHHYPHSDMQASFDHTLSLASQLPPIQAAEVVKSTNNGNEGSGEISIEDFLEMDDLLGPEPNVQNTEEALGTPSSNGVDGFAAADIYNDLSMILNDMGQGGSEQFSQPYFSNGGMSNIVSHSYVNTVENGSAIFDEFTFQNEVNMTSSQVWAPEQRSELFTPETNQAAGSHPIYDGWFSHAISSSTWQELSCPSGERGD